MTKLVFLWRGRKQAGQRTTDDVNNEAFEVEGDEDEQREDERRRRRRRLQQQWGVK